MFIYICACSSYLNKRFRFKTVISRSLQSFNSGHRGTRGVGRHAFFSKTSSFLLHGDKTTVVHGNAVKPVLSSHTREAQKVANTGLTV